MIFKTFDSDIDKWTSKIGIFGKSFNELGTAVNYAFKSAIDNIDNFDKNVGFWESLKNNLFSKKADKDWIKNSLGDIISKENIDSYIDELDLDSAKRKLEDVFKWDDIIQNSDKTWQDYFDTLDDGESYIVDLIKNTDDLSKLTGEDLINANKKARESVIAHNNALKQQTLGAKAATVATKALSVALNMVAMWAITEAISAAVSWMNSYTEAAKNAKEGSEALTQKMKDFNSKVSENAKTLKELNPQYQKLSKGVNELGGNINDSTEEYEEYKDIVQQISDIMPDLSVRFNSQGEAIGFTDGKLQDLTKTYEEYRKKIAEGFLTNGDGEGHTIKDIIDNYNNQTDLAWYDNFFGKLMSNTNSNTLGGQLSKLIGGENNPIIKGVKSFFGMNPSFEDMLDFQGESNRDRKKFYESLQNLSKDKFGYFKDFTNILGYDVEDITEMSDKDFEEFKKVLQNEANRYGAVIESAADSMKQVITEKLAANDGFYKLNEKQRDNAVSLVSGLNDELLQELDIENEIDMGNFADTLMKQFSGNEDFSKAWDKLFGKGLDKLPVDKYVTKVRSLIGTIGNAIGLENKEQQDKLLTRLGFDNLDELVNDYNGAIQSAVDKWKLDGTQKEDLEKFFEENSINTEEEIDAWKEIAAEADNAAEAKRKYLSMNAVDKTAQQLETLKKTYESASEDVTVLTTALSESVSGKGLSTDSVDAVTSMFSDLKGYDVDKLLDKTANGLRINTRELEKLKKEYDDNTAKEFYNNVEDAYNAWQTALMNGEEQSVIDSLRDQYQQAAQLADQYIGLTSAYNQWQNALSTANEGDMYDSIYGNIKSVKELYKKGLVGTDDFRTYVDLISPKDLAGATTDEIVKAYHESIGKINRYFTEGQSGAQNFLKDVQKINSEWAHMNKDGSWEIDFGAGGSTDKDVAKKLGIDVEALQAILRKLSDYGFDIDLGSGIDSLEMMGKSADKAYAKLKKLGKTNYKFKFDTGDIAEVNKQIAKAEKVLDKFRDKDGNVDLSINGAQEAQSMLIKLMTEKQELEKPAILQVDTKELSGKAASVVTMLQKIQQDINTYDVQVAVGADTTEAEKKINSDIKAIKKNYGNELANIHINLDNIDSARQELSTLTKENIDVMVNAIVNHKEVDEYKKEKEEKKLKVITEVDDKAVNSFMGKTLEKTIKAKVEVDDSELDKVSSKKSKDSSQKKKETKSKSDDKKAKADGTFNNLKDTLASRGFANASGNISIPKNQTALVNELGEELIVRDGKWFTVKGSAQFKELKKGDIVFNHLQTRQLLKNGKITSSNNRGKMAFASGSMNTGSSSGNGKFYGDSSSSTKKKSTSKKSSKSKKSSSNSSDKKNSKQVIDWIARKLDILQGKIDLTKEKFENLFSVRKQNNNVKKQIGQTIKLLDAQEKAVTKYQKKADSIKLSGSLKEKVRNGAIKGSLSELIKEYGEKTANQINKYQDYIDKVNEAKKAVAGLKAEIKELSRQKLDLKIDDNERKRTYQEAKYANAKTTDAKNKILDKEIDTYNSDDRAYNRYYKRAVQSRNKDGKEAKTAVSKVKGLSKKDKNNIKKLIKKGQAIPSALMKKVEKYNASAYKKLADYNNSVDFVADALRDKKLANEENKTNRREKKAEQHQNRADEAEAKYNVKQQREANAATAKEKNKHEAASMKYLKNQYKHLIEIAKLEGDTTEQKRLQLELDEKIAESYKTRYDNIKTEYENKTGLNDAQIATVQAQIATLEAAGKSATKEIYEGMMKVSADTKEKLLKERAELEEAGKKFEYGSEEWYAWQNALLAIGQQMESCTQNTIEFQKAINELDLKKFSLIAAQLDATQSHLDFLVNMLSHKDLVSKESGGFTDEGIAAISLRFSDMENKVTIVKNAQNTLKKLYGQHLSGIDGLNEEEFLAKREEQLDIIRDSIEAIADEKDAILDLVEDAIQVQIDAINELIEKKRKALQSEKDLYEYQKKVAKQTKNIALIQKQIAALSGDKSEEAQARLQKLKVSLEEAQQDLKDTEYDKWLSDQEDMLDSLADEMEDFWENIINELRDDINGSMDKLTQMVSDNPEAVARALDTLGLGDALSVITAYNKDDTHTDKTTDYGGSSYSSTYDDKTGTNVNNTFKTSIDDLVASTGKVSDSAEELAKRAEEEAKRKADQERIAKQKADQERFAKQKKEDAKMEAYKRADSIMEQVYSGSKSVSVTSAPKEGVQAIVEEFLNSSSLHKPKSEKEKKRIKTDPLLKYISENYSGKTLSLANEIKLGAYLGIPVSSKDKVTSSEANKILKAFKGAGFSEGGIVSEINKAIKENGDDGIATVKKGEAVLTPEQTEAVQDLSERYVRVGSGLTPEQEDYLKSFIGTSPITAQTMENMEKATKAFEVNNNYARTSNVNVGDVHVHLDGSHVVDKESFRKTLRDYEIRSDIEQIALGDLTLKKGSIRNSMRYI